MFSKGIFVLLLLMCSLTFAQTTQKNLGVVTNIDDCRSGKYSLECTVLTTTHSLRTDISKWPGNILQKGDEISFVTKIDGSSQTRLYCKNGKCTDIWVCWKWFKCWES